jgi:putative membrane protein
MYLVNEAGLALAQAQANGWGHDGGGYWWIWRLGMLVFWVVLIALAFWWFRRAGWGRQPSGAERARDILAERFARGEITVEEYNERLGQLR